MVFKWFLNGFLNGKTIKKPLKNHLKINFGPFKNGFLNGRKHFKIFLNGKTI